jgi:hypothetical protein
VACANHAVRAKTAVVDKASSISHLVRCSNIRGGSGSHVGLDNDPLEVGAVRSEPVESEGALADVVEDMRWTTSISRSVFSLSAGSSVT